MVYLTYKTYSEKSGSDSGSFVDSSDVFEGNIVDKSTSCILVKRDKALRGAMG